MKRQASITILRGVKTSLFLLAVIGASTFLTLSNPRPAQAEGLFYNLRCSMVKMLGRPCQPTVAPTTQPPVTPVPSEGSGTDTDKNKEDNSNPKPVSGGTTSKPMTTSSSSQASPPSVNAQQVTPAPIELDDELLEEIPPIARVQSTGTSYSFPAHVAPLIQSGDNSAVLSSATTPPVEAGEGGWSVCGVSWVWWLGAAVSLIAGLYAGKRVLTRGKNIKLAKS